MPRKKEIDVYAFEELQADVQQSVLDRFRPDMFDPFHTDQLTELFQERIKEAGFEDIDDVRWSLSHSQGDGVAFYGSFDVEEYLSGKGTKNWRDWAPGKGIPVAYRPLFGESPFVEITAQIHKVNPHYDHANSMSVELGLDYIDELPRGVTEEQVEKLIKELEGEIQESVRSLSKELEKIGYEDIEYITSDESIRDLIEANEYEFDVVGGIL